MISSVLNLEDAGKVANGFVVSQSLYNDENIDVSLYGLGDDEMISYEKSGFDKVYLGISDILNLKIKDENHKEKIIDVNPYNMVYIEKNSLRELCGYSSYAFIMITIKRSKTMIKNLDKEKLLNLTEEIPYEDKKIVSKTLVKDEKLIMTLIAFDEKQELSTHSAPGDALVVALDGEAKIVINGKDYIVKKGESIIMPANIPHGVYVGEGKKFKMLLIVSK